MITLSGLSGLSGLCELSRLCGLSGLCGLCGLSGKSGLSGLSGFSGLSGLSCNQCDDKSLSKKLLLHFRRNHCKCYKITNYTNVKSNFRSAFCIQKGIDEVKGGITVEYQRSIHILKFNIF